MLNEFILISQVQMQSKTVPGTSWDSSREIQERNVDRSLRDLHSKRGITVDRSYHTLISEPDSVFHTC